MSTVMCTPTCICQCGQTGCKCADAVHATQPSALGTVVLNDAVGSCSECKGAARLVNVVTASGRILTPSWCPRCDRAKP